jgi:hypothetical protein
MSYVQNETSRLFLETVKREHTQLTQWYEDTRSVKVANAKIRQ